MVEQFALKVKVLKKEHVAVTAEGQVVKFVEDVFEKDKKHIVNLMEISNDSKLSAAQKVILTNSACQVKQASETVAKHFGTVISKEAQNLKGWIINITKNKKNFTIRIMDAGSGQRTKPYFRVSVENIGTLDAFGKPSSLAKATHIDLASDYLKQFDTIIDSYLLSKGSKL